MSDYWTRHRTQHGSAINRVSPDGQPAACPFRCPTLPNSKPTDVMNRIGPCERRTSSRGADNYAPQQNIPTCKRGPGQAPLASRCTSPRPLPHG